MSEFVWNVEEQKLRELSKEEILDKYVRSGVYSLQEMQDAMDKYGNTAKWSIIWEKFELFQKEKDTIKKDKYGHYNTISLNAWYKKNGVPQKDYSGRKPGSYSMGYYCNINITWKTREEIEGLIPSCFYQLLEKLKARENNWFKDHDEYTIKCRMIEENINNHLPVPFEEDIHFSAFFDGWIYRYEPEGKRKLTMEELDKIIVFQNAIANAIKNVVDTQSPNITI